MFPLLIPFGCTSSTEMGAIVRASDSRQFSGMTIVELSRWSINPGSKSFSRSMCPCKLSPNFSRSFHHSLAPNRTRWLHSSRMMNVTSDVTRNKVVSQNLADENTSDTLATRVLKFCKSLTVLVVVLSTVLGHTSARAGVESTLQPKFNKLVDSSTNNVSSVEAILARQLARRFREMSDEELILVLQELLKASRSSISPEDLVLDGNNRKEDFLSKDGIKEGNRKPVNDGPITKDPIPETKQGGEAGNGGPDLSAASSKVVDSATKNQKDNSSKQVDGIDSAPEPEGREVKSGGPEMSVPGSNRLDQAPKQGNSVLPGTSRAPSMGKEAVSEEALTPKNSRQPGSATKEPEEEQFSERSDDVEESESQDMTVMLWDEWRRRLQGKTLAESTNDEESLVVASATDFWQNMQTLSMSALNRVGTVSAWISDNWETVGGGVVASGGIIFALFIRQKILFLSLGKGNENGDFKVDRTPSKAQLSASNLKSSEQYLRGFLQAVATPFKGARNRLLGLEQSATQVEASSGTTSSNTSGESTTAGSSTGELVPPWPSEDDMLPKRPEARGKSANTTQDLDSYPVGISKPSEKFPDRFVKRTNDSPMPRLKSGPENRDVVYGSGLDDFRTVKPSDLQGRKNDKEDDVAYRNFQFPPSTSATVHDKRKNLESPTKDENVSKFIANLSPLIGTRGLPGTSNTKEERNSAAKSFRENVQGMTVGKRTEAESSQKVKLASSERKEDDGKTSSFESEFLQKDSTYQTRDGDVKGSVRESANKPSFWSSSSRLQDRFSSASIDSDEIDEGVSSRKTTSPEKSGSFVSGRSDLNDSKEGAPSPVQQVSEGKEVVSDSVGFRDSLQSSKTASPTDEGSNRFEDADLWSDLSQKTHNEDVPQTRTVKQYPGAGDPLLNNRPTLVRNSDRSGLLHEAEHAKNTAGIQGEIAGGAAKVMDTQTQVFHLEKVNAQSSGSNVPYSIAEQIQDGNNLSKSIFSTRADDTALKIHSKSERDQWEVSEKEVQDGKVAATPVSSEESATRIQQEKMHDDGMISSATLRKRLLESGGEEDENSVETSASKAGGGGGDDDDDQGIDILTEDFWAGGVTTAFVAMSFEHSTNDAGTEDKFDDSGASSSGGSEVESKRAGLSRAELDSFSHNQDFWVRDSDGVFIKHPRENQGFILQNREGSRVPGNGGGIKNEVVDPSIASKRVFNKLNKYANPAGKARVHKQAKSSGFDYGQLYLTPNDEKKNSGEPYDCKARESKRYTTFPSPSNTGKARPIRYGIGRSP